MNDTEKLRRAQEIIEKFMSAYAAQTIRIMELLNALRAARDDIRVISLSGSSQERALLGVDAMYRIQEFLVENDNCKENNNE